MTQLHAHFLPELTTPEKLAGSTVVVIDVLRASTVIVHALAAGAQQVIACLEVDQARQTVAELGAARAVLGGERQGLKIEGFHHGNSPEEFTPQTVGGRTLVLTTTNGTKAMMRCGAAGRVLVGGFVNRAAVAGALRSQPRVDLLCAGTRGQITGEDVLLAGALVDSLQGGASGTWQLNDQAAMAAQCWRAALSGGASLAEALRQTQGGRNLLALGFGQDIEVAARLDRFSLVPEFDPATRTIRAR